MPIPITKEWREHLQKIAAMTSAAKKASSRANGKLGGRPKKQRAGEGTPAQPQEERDYHA